MASKSPYLATHTLRSNQLSYSLKEQVEQLRAQLGDAERRGAALIKEAGLNIVLTVLRTDGRIGGRDTPGACAIQVLDGRVRVQSPIPLAELGAGDIAVFDATIGQEVVALEDSAVLVTVALDPSRPVR